MVTQSFGEGGIPVRDFGRSGNENDNRVGGVWSILLAAGFGLGG